MKARHLELSAGLLGLLGSLLVFSLWPQLDTSVSAWFFDPVLQRFTATHWPWVIAIHEGFPVVGRVLFVGCVIGLVWQRFQPNILSRAQRRRCMAWLLLVLVGIGLVVDWAFKDHVGRPRPEQIHAFAGDLPFVPVMQVSQHCDVNCSFVSGHAAGAFSIMAWGLWAPWSRRKQWLGLSMGLGAAIGLMRIAQGGHFLSDVVLAGFTVWLVLQAMRFGWLHWRLVKFRQGQSQQGV